MDKDEAISEYLHGLTSLRLAMAINPSPAYVKKVAKRVSKKLKNKKNAKIFKNIAKQTLPGRAINLFTDQVAQAYAERGYDWKE